MPQERTVVYHLLLLNASTTIRIRRQGQAFLQAYFNPLPLSVLGVRFVRPSGVFRAAESRHLSAAILVSALCSRPSVLVPVSCSRLARSPARHVKPGNHTRTRWLKLTPTSQPTHTDRLCGTSNPTKGSTAMLAFNSATTFPREQRPRHADDGTPTSSGNTSFHLS